MLRNNTILNHVNNSIMGSNVKMLKNIRWNEFIHIVESRSENIICIGAGKNLKKMEKKTVPENFFDKVIDILDNNKNKQNTLIEFGDKTYKIESVDKLNQNYLTGKCILITMSDGYHEVIDELETMGLYDNVDVYLLTVMNMLEVEDIAMTKNIPDDIRLSDTMLIPKKIHYCWFGQNPIPDKNKKWMESWLKFCPDYEIIEWNEDNYDITKNQYMYQAYQAGKWGFVPDYARLDIIYNYGGIYLDTDVELIDNIDDLLYQKAFAGFESDKYVNFGLGFGAQKGNSIIKALMDNYNERNFIKEDGTLDLIASPVIQTEALKGMGLRIDGEYQVLDDITIYPEKMLCGKSLSTKRIKLKTYTKSIHHYDGSWLDAAVRNKAKEREKNLNDVLKRNYEEE